MKLHFSDFPRKAQLVLLMTCATVPAVAMAAATTEPELLGRIALFPLAYVLLALLCLTLPGRPRLIVGVCSSAALTVTGVAALWASQSVPVLAVPVGYSVLLLKGLQMAAWPKEREVFPAWYAVGLILHALAQLMLSVANRTGSMGALLPARPWLMLCFVLFLLLSMLSMNRASLDCATLGRQRIPLTMRVKNHLVVAGFLALALLLTSAPGVARAVTAAWNALSTLIARAVLWLMNLFGGSSESGASAGGGGFDMSGLLEEAEPSALALLLERVLLALASIAMLALAALFLRLVWRNLVALLRELLERLGLFAAAASEDYIDEITDTREDAEDRSLLRHLRGRIGWTDESRLPPGERIRRRYLRLRLKHREWQGSQTARETLPAEAARLYERARYSAHEVSAQDAQRFADEVKRC